MTRHNNVVTTLYDLCKTHASYSEVYADNVGVGYKPLDIVAPHPKGIRPTVYSYHPDVWARIRRSSNIDVYEVWDSQTVSDCVEDVVLSALTPNIYTLSIICFDSEAANLAKELVSTVLASIHDAKGNRLLDPSKVLPYVVLIPANLSDSQLQNFLGTKLSLQTGNVGLTTVAYRRGRSCGRGNHHYVRQGSYMKCTKCGSLKTIRSRI
jgi:hypothetical protein